MSSIAYKKHIKLLISRFIVGVVASIAIEQNLYEIVGKYVLLNLAIRRLFYGFLFRKILWSTVVLKTPIWFIQLILLFIFRTSRVTIVGKENLKRVGKEKQSFIFAFWHGNYTLLLASLRTNNAVALVHWSFRGNYIAQLFSTFNYRIVRACRSGRSVLELIKTIKQGYSGFIAVDGPQGPAHKTKPGIIYVAREAGAKIIPIGLEARRGFVLRRRWDNHFIPLPFNRITVSFGKSIDVKPGDSLAVKEEQVTRSLLELTNGKKADASFLSSSHQDSFQF